MGISYCTSSLKGDISHWGTRGGILIGVVDDDDDGGDDDDGDRKG